MWLDKLCLSADYLTFFIMNFILGVPVAGKKEAIQHGHLPHVVSQSPAVTTPGSRSQLSTSLAKTPAKQAMGGETMAHPNPDTPGTTFLAENYVFFLLAGT